MKRLGWISGAIILIAFRAAGQSGDFTNVSSKQELVDVSSHFAKQDLQHFTTDINRFYNEGKKGKVVLGYTTHSVPVEAWFFPGTSKKKALIISGVHGSELASIDIANIIMAQLQSGETPYYNVVVIPLLFPENAVKASAIKDNQNNVGRYTTEWHADPNRQMPSPGKAFEEDCPFDAKGRLIENENLYLLRLIQSFQPSRIVNLHSIKDTSKAGIFADPRTDCAGVALGFESDSLLAITMAKYIVEYGGTVPGNNLCDQPTALYYKDPVIASPGMYQPRNLLGSQLNGERGAGVSLGTWASTAVCDSIASRNAIRLMTVEFPGYVSYVPWTGKEQIKKRFVNLYLYASAITKIFLQNNFPE